MILNNFSFVEENIVLFFKNESRSEVCLLRVYDYDHQVLVSRRDIRIAADGKAAFPISYLTGDNFHDGVKYVLNVQEHHEINCEKVYRLNSAYDLYIYVADNNKITFEIKSISPHCELVGILETKCDVSLQFSRLSGAKATKLLLKRRVSNKFWQYHDREFSFDLNGPSITIEKQILGEFFLTRPDSLWDFFIRNEFSDGSFFDSYVYHKDCDLAFSNIRIYVGNGKTLILRNAFASQVKNFELGRYEELVDSIQLCISRIFKSHPKGSQIQNGDIELIISTTKDVDELDFQNRQFVRFSPVSRDGEDFFFNLPIGKYLSSNFGPINDDIHSHINLQFYVYYVGKYYPVTTRHNTDSIHSTYLPINSRLSGRIYAKDERLYLYTHTGSFDQSRKIEVAVFGTCFTRNIFRSSQYFNENYKIWYSCGFTQFHSTLISLASKPYHDLDGKLRSMERVAKRYLELDFHKNYIEQLKLTKPKYILIDLYCDATLPTLVVGDNSCISINLYNRYSSIISGLEKNNHLIRQSNWDEYFSIWKKSMRLFIASLREITPERNIILVRSRFALNYKDDDGSVKKFSNQWRIMKDNLIWDRLEDSLLLEFSDIRTIDMRDCRLVADKQSPLGFSPSHYETEYYKQCLTKLNEITLEDLISEQM